LQMANIYYKKLYQKIGFEREDVELSYRSTKCLKKADIQYVGELVLKTERELMKIKSFGPKSLAEIKEVLAEMGLTLGMKVILLHADLQHFTVVVK